MKTCTRCKENLSLDKFSERAPGYLYRQCKSCRQAVRNERFKNDPESKEKARQKSNEWYYQNKDRVKERLAQNKEYRKDRDKWYRIKNTYNLSKDQYLQILSIQNNRCAICKIVPSRYYIDHDHSCCPSEVSCGKCIRGLICQKCNIFMHYIDEYEQYIDIAKEYKNRNIVKEIYENPL